MKSATKIGETRYHGARAVAGSGADSRTKRWQPRSVQRAGAIRP